MNDYQIVDCLLCLLIFMKCFTDATCWITFHLNYTVGKHGISRDKPNKKINSACLNIKFENLK